ncbi:hypothetical protein ACSQ67_010423 [Phaseolus vulgaris]
MKKVFVINGVQVQGDLRRRGELPEMWIGKWNDGGSEVDTEASSDEGSLGASLCDSVGLDFGEAGEGEGAPSEEEDWGMKRRFGRLPMRPRREDEKARRVVGEGVDKCREEPFNRVSSIRNSLRFVSRIEDSLGTRPLLEEVERVWGRGGGRRSRQKKRRKKARKSNYEGEWEKRFSGGLSAVLGTGAKDVVEGGVILSLRRVGCRVWLGKSEVNIP